MDNLSDSSIAGTQAIVRAMLVLRAIASAGRRGARVADIVKMSALPQATVSRMLSSLLREGVVERDSRLRKYFVGPMIHELGMVARASYSLPQSCRHAMQMLVEQTQETIYLSERRGAEAICTAAEEGTFPIKAIPLHVGIRRPLGVGAGGLAILAAMESDHSKEIMSANASRYPAYGGVDLEYLAEALVQTRERGWSLVANKATTGMTAIGAAIQNSFGEPVAALSISAIASRMTDERSRTLSRLLLKHCSAISKQLSESAVTAL